MILRILLTIAKSLSYYSILDKEKSWYSWTNPNSINNKAQTVISENYTLWMNELINQSINQSTNNSWSFSSHHIQPLFVTYTFQHNEIIFFTHPSMLWSRSQGQLYYSSNHWNRDGLLLNNITNVNQKKKRKIVRLELISLQIRAAFQDTQVKWLHRMKHPHFCVHCGWYFWSRWIYSSSFFP